MKQITQFFLGGESPTLMFTLRTHDIMIFGGMNGKLASENFF